MDKILWQGDWSHLREVGGVFLGLLCSVYLLLTLPALSSVTVEFIQNPRVVRSREGIGANKSIVSMTESQV